MFLSISVRCLMNVEALNSVETVGNLSRHRTVPMVIPQHDGYTLKYVPAVSGESIAHGYQALLVDVAKSMKLPVGVFSSRNEFIKFSEDSYLTEEGVKPPKSHEDIMRFEIDVLLKDIVADVGGFLYTGDIPVKRTSRFQVGYMIPAIQDVLNATAMEAEFHVRYLFSQAGKDAKLGQIPYNVEIASSVYTLNLNLDLAGIGVPSNVFGETPKGARDELEKKKQELSNSIPNRRKAALIALLKLLTNNSYGGKRSRFFPNIELRSSVLALSRDSFTVSPGNYTDYVERTWKRAQKYLALTGHEVKVWCVNREGLSVPAGVSKHETLEDVFEDIMNLVTQGK
ncbi:MAG: type I-A CRISPR-associated protein Cas7/Csa2 [Aigarchaeota archaeon]|nr:type I-A CRISPR-associated protein Cas7/Csa2 [Aigarchaeota archaeon]